MAGSIRKRPDRGADAHELRVYVSREARGRFRHESQLIRGSERSAELERERLVLNQDAEPSIVPDDASRPWGPVTTINDAVDGWRTE